MLPGFYYAPSPPFFSAEFTTVLSTSGIYAIISPGNQKQTPFIKGRETAKSVSLLEENMDKYEKINKLKCEKDTVILAHYYVDGAVQKAADFVGDSYALAKKAASVSQQNILFAGVSFMGESAKLLNPGKHVYMADPCAGCKMADMVTPNDVKNIKKCYPDAAVVCYVNSTAAVKAVSDVCVTSSNAVRVVRKLKEKQIYFIPDAHLAQFVAKEAPEKEFIFHNGYCPTHQQITKEGLLRAKAAHPGALTLSHPECKEEILALSDFVGSTADIIRFAREHEANEYLVATETGVFYQLEQENPGKEFFPVLKEQVCPDMKLITLDKLEYILGHLDTQQEIILDGELIDKAKKPLERMLLLAE